MPVDNRKIGIGAINPISLTVGVTAVALADAADLGARRYAQQLLIRTKADNTNNIVIGAADVTSGLPGFAADITIGFNGTERAPIDLSKVYAISDAAAQTLELFILG